MVKTKALPLYLQILIAFILGIGWSIFSSQFFPGLGVITQNAIKPVGVLFLSGLKLCAVPLIFFSILNGLNKLQDLQRLGSISFHTALLFLFTCTAAILIGLGLALWLQPGAGITPAILAGLMGNASAATVNSQIPNAAGFVAALLPENIVATLADNTQMLQVVILALLIGFALSQLKTQQPAPYLSGLISEIEQLLILLVGIIMKAAPFGVFALAATLEADWAVLKALSAYMLVVLMGLILQFVLVYGSVIRVLAGRSPFRIWGEIREVLLMAFSSSSSSATLPLTFHAVKNKLKVRDEVADIVLPLGTTINMDGTALYQSVAVVFMAQALQISLDWMDYVLILLTAIMASVGAAGVPGAGLATLVLILQAVGIPEAALALILVPDRLLDMCRTVINVAGDVSAAVAVEALNPEKNHSE